MFGNVNLSNLENVLQRNLRSDRGREWIFRVFGGTVLKVCPLGGNYGGAIVNSIYVPVCPKKTLDTSLMRDKSWLI